MLFSHRPVGSRLELQAKDLVWIDGVIGHSSQGRGSGAIRTKVNSSNCNFCNFGSLRKIIEERSLNMDLTKTIEDLRREKEKLEQVIASLEELRAIGDVPVRRRRGRKFMSLEERREVSARMRRLWEDRHKQRRAWS